MDDRQIEERIRQAFSPETPESLRDRVLRAARQERTDAARRTRTGRLRWASAMAAALVWVAFAAGVDTSRGARLEAMTLRGAPEGMTIALAAQQIQMQQAQIQRGGVL